MDTIITFVVTLSLWFAYQYMASKPKDPSDELRYYFNWDDESNDE